MELRQPSDQRACGEKILEAEIMCTQPAGQVADSLGQKIRECAIGVPVTRRIDQNHGTDDIELGEEIHSASAAVEQSRTEYRRLLLEAPNGVHADALVTHKHVADAEYENRSGKLPDMGLRVRLIQERCVE